MRPEEITTEVQHIDADTVRVFARYADIEEWDDCSPNQPHIAYIKSQMMIMVFENYVMRRYCNRYGQVLPRYQVKVFRMRSEFYESNVWQDA